ncbi:MAG: GWxTD domain-containing protein [Candidatus Krumholzibacteriota bacterium]|nr:GWxTD domain-containing protein [Candidatus Krumholzibacteriota bacterium]
MRDDPWQRAAGRLLLAALLLGGLGCSPQHIDPEITVPFDTGTPPERMDAADCRRHAIWRDLGILLDRRETASLMAVHSTTALAAWVERFWRLRDPTPTTPDVNERRDEHYRRLAEARARYPGRGPHGVDVRGRDYVLFGPPDRVVEQDVAIGGFYHPRREAWIWDGLGLLAEYWDFDLDGCFTPAGMNVRARHMIGRYADRTPLASGDPPILGLPVPTEDYYHMRGHYGMAVAARQDAYAPEPAGEPLWAVLAAACFQGAEGRTRVDVAHQVRLAELAFAAAAGGGPALAGLEQRAVLLDDGRRAVALAESLLVVPGGDRDGEGEILYAGGLSLAAPPGAYELALRLTDPGSGRTRLLTTPLTVPAFPTDSLAVSDILFASLIGSRGGRPRFPRGEWDVWPHPLHAYSAALPIRVYFEIYGLATDLAGANHYRLAYSIRPVERLVRYRRLWLREEAADGTVSATLDSRGQGHVARQPLTLDARTLEPGIYILEVRVEDLLARRTATHEGRFSIVPPEDLAGVPFR